MAKSAEPVVLELAALPREQMGPFLILGVDKSADKAAIEAHWADRLKWARRQLIKVPLEDINWARDILTDPERRLKYDAGCLNADTTDTVIATLSAKYGGDEPTRATLWKPLDVEKPMAEYTPAAEIPDKAEVRAAVRPPEIPQDIPPAVSLLTALTRTVADPWSVDLP